MNKVISLALALIMVLCITGCSQIADGITELIEEKLGETVSEKDNNKKEDKDITWKKDDTEEKKEDTKNEEKSKNNSSSFRDESTNNPSRDDNNRDDNRGGSDRTEGIRPEESSGAVSSSISDARTTTSPERPAALGEWVKSTTYCVKSDQYDTIYWRVTNITDDCQREIDAYNAGNHIYMINELDDDNLKYMMATYEVYYPSEFPASEYGLTSPDISISVTSPEGFFSYGGDTYIGLGTTVSVVDRTTIQPGETYQGKIVFAMLKQTDYLFRYYHYPHQIGDEIIYDYIANR